MHATVHQDVDQEASNTDEESRVLATTPRAYAQATGVKANDQRAKDAAETADALPLKKEEANGSRRMGDTKNMNMLSDQDAVNLTACYIRSHRPAIRQSGKKVLLTPTFLNCPFPPSCCVPNLLQGSLPLSQGTDLPLIHLFCNGPFPPDRHLFASPPCGKAHYSCSRVQTRYGRAWYLTVPFPPGRYSFAPPFRWKAL